MNEQAINLLIALYAYGVVFMALAGLGEYMVERVLEWRSRRYQRRTMARVVWLWPTRCRRF
jgi:Mn2+/Fe2+ NRAMP family transporter